MRLQRGINMRFLGLLVLVFAWAIDGHADAMDGDDLLQVCSLWEKPVTEQSRKELHDYGVCLGALNAVAETDRLFSEWKYKYPSFCVPNLALEHMAMVVIAYLKRHPEEAKYTATSVILRAFSDAFPPEFDENNALNYCPGTSEQLSETIPD